MLDLVHAGGGDVPAEGDERGAGVLGRPELRNQRAPWRAISARCANVSALFTSVGGAADAALVGIGGVKVGFASPPMRKLTSADSWPVM